MICYTNCAVNSSVNFLLVENQQGMPHLIIGHHLLIGKVMDLEKPFAVLHKTSDWDGENNKGGPRYDVCALVKKKIIFKVRPKPIVSKTVPITRR